MNPNHNRVEFVSPTDTSTQKATNTHTRKNSELQPMLKNNLGSHEMFSANIENIQNANTNNQIIQNDPVNELPEDVIFSFRSPSNAGATPQNIFASNFQRENTRPREVSTFQDNPNNNSRNNSTDITFLRIDEVSFNSKVKEIIIEMIKFQVISFFFSIFVILWIKWGFSILYSLVFLWFIDAFSIFAKVIKFPKLSKDERKGFCLDLLGDFSFFGFKILLALILVHYISLKLIFGYLPYLLFQLIKNGNMLCEKNRDICKFYTIASNCLMLFCYTQTVCVLLKLDGFIQWTWREVFWTFWIFFSIMIGISFSMLLILVSKTCSYIFGEIKKFEIRGIFWVFSMLGGFTTFSCVFVVKFLDYVENNENLDSAFINPIYCLLAYNILISLYSLAYIKDMEKFFRRAFSLETEQNQMVSINEKKEKTKPSESPQKIEIPRFLLRSNSTYYKKATEEDYREEIAKSSRRRMKKLDRDNQEKIGDYRQLGSKSDNTEHTTREQFSQFTSLGSARYRDEPLVKTQQSPRSPRKSPRFELKDPINKDKPIQDKIIMSDGKLGLKLNTIQSEIEKEKSMNLSFNILHDENHARNFTLITGANIENHIESDNGNLRVNLTDSNIVSPKGGNKIKKVNFLKNPPTVNYIARQEEGANLSVTFVDVDKQEPIPLTDIQIIDSKKLNNNLDAHLPNQNESIRENESFKESERSNNACLVCFDKQPDAVFMECGHGGKNLFCFFFCKKNAIQ